MSDKPTLLLMAPVATVSGYGARSRDIAYSLIKSQKYEVKIWNTRWGTTPMNALSPENPKHKAILDCLLDNPNLPAQPDVFVQITVPNEFQRIGKYNIGITAGIETTIASAPWIEGCNRMDLVLTSSQHSKKVFQESMWEKRDQNGTPMGALRLERPIEVLFEGVDLETYFPTKSINKTVDDELKQIKEDFAFLFVGHWLAGEFGEDRKNVSAMIRIFLEAFKNKASHNQPALILKTSQADFSPLDREDLLKKIEQIYQSLNTSKALPNVYLLHGDLTDEEMNSLYNHPKVKAHVTFTKGEGYGRPLAEASLSQKIIIAPNWSGHTDFLKEAVLLPGQLTNVHPSAAWENVILQESQWFSVDYAYAAGAMKDVVENYKNFSQIAKKQAHHVKTNFSFDAMHDLLHNLLDKNVPEFPKQVQLKLPQLKKIELPKLKKV
jgi:glycosyltransferase involved in cell wall biosynthesis